MGTLAWWESGSVPREIGSWRGVGTQVAEPCCVPGSVLSSVSEVNPGFTVTLFTPMLQLGKLRPREAKELAQITQLSGGLVGPESRSPEPHTFPEEGSLAVVQQAGGQQRVVGHGIGLHGTEGRVRHDRGQGLLVQRSAQELADALHRALEVLGAGDSERRGQQQEGAGVQEAGCPGPSPGRSVPPAPASLPTSKALHWAVTNALCH